MRPYLRFVALGFLGSGLAPLAILTASRYLREVNLGSHPQWPRFSIEMAIAALAVAILTIVFDLALRRFEPYFERNARAQAEFLRMLPARRVSLAIVGAAAASLFLELAIIRWQGTVFGFFAFYKNFSLLCCFAGLGLGYAMAGGGRVPLAFSIPLFGWQFAWMLALRYGLSDAQRYSLTVLPFTEQLSMGMIPARRFAETLHFYWLLGVVFLLTALAFIPIGQLCGILMERTGKLAAYGFNLVGSFFGVLLILGLSALWTPPPVWFALGFAALLMFYAPGRSSRIAGLVPAALAIIVLAWPAGAPWQRIYSPYQLLEVDREPEVGMLINAAGTYYQQVMNLAASNPAVEKDPRLKQMKDFYELPYRFHPKAESAVIIGAGAGNDVAAALRRGVAQVDAVEIDPAILMLGRIGHPEHPYDDPRVHAIVDDARSFLRNTNRTYDLIVYGLLDSHTLLSQASNVRLDSFVYTVEGLREARRRLKPGGIFALSFATIAPQLGRKVYLMMQAAFDGRGPTCITAGYNAAVVFLDSESGDLTPAPTLLRETGFRDSTRLYSSPALRADVSTDDWPFFYMPRRVYPYSYIGMAALIGLLSLILAGNFIGEKPRFSELPFFLLGAGFMLIETKGITELGLTFGNTWQVIGVVIAGMLAMAFLANCAVQWLNPERVAIPYVLLLGSLFIGWWVAGAGGLSSTWGGRLATVAILTSPIFFSGVVFSTLLSERGEISGIMAANLLGAVCGGLLEYNSMYFGFRFLYLMAAGIYFAALVWEIAVPHDAVKSAAIAPPEAKSIRAAS